MASNNTNSGKNFEDKLLQLENILSQLEEQALPLEKSMELFEKAVKLSKECEVQLLQAEQRIEMLLPLEKTSNESTSELSSNNNEASSEE